MALKFALFENHLTSDPDDYMAVVQDLRSKAQEDVIDLMISRGSTVTKAEALSVLEEYAGAIVLLLKDGYAINTPIFNLSPSIKGVFYGPDEPFNSPAHAVKINITAGTRLREVGPQVAVERVKGGSPQPDPEYLDDLGSDTRNEQLTPGNIARLRGSRLKFETGDLMQGVFLIAADTTVTRVATVSRNKPGEIDFLVPALPPGVYRLEVRAVLFQGKTLKVGVLPALLTVG